MSKYGQKSISHKLTSNYKKISDEIEIGDSFLSLTNYIYIPQPKVGTSLHGETRDAFL